MQIVSRVSRRVLDADIGGVGQVNDSDVVSLCAIPHFVMTVTAIAETAPHIDAIVQGRPVHAGGSSGTLPFPAPQRTL
jgi:hypothetical protein